jgi:hypothetical protein
LPTYVDKETGEIREAPGQGPELHGQDALDYDRRVQERRRAEQERLDTELEQRRAPWLAECDRLKKELGYALQAVRDCTFEIDASSVKACKRSGEKQARLDAQVKIAESVERNLNALEVQGPPA